MFFKSPPALTPPALILASTSVYRRELLGRLNVPFECVAPGVDETRQAGESALSLVARLARAKAGAVAARHPDAWVIGSDQVAVLVDDSRQETILGKPGTQARCIEQLRSCSGRAITFLTAVSLLRRRDAAVFEIIDSTRVAFRALDAAAIERYVAKESPLDCAGGLKSEGLGITLCDSIEGSDPSALIGLPLIRLSAALRGVGFDVP